MEPASERAGIRELRQHASHYVDLATAGHTVDITNRGRVVARLVPAGGAIGPLADLVARNVVRPPQDDGDLLDVSALRTLDAVHLASALAVASGLRAFVAYDT